MLEFSQEKETGAFESPTALTAAVMRDGKDASRAMIDPAIHEKPIRIGEAQWQVNQDFEGSVAFAFNRIVSGSDQNIHPDPNKITTFLGTGGLAIFYRDGEVVGDEDYQTQVEMRAQLMEFLNDDQVQDRIQALRLRNDLRRERSIKTLLKKAVSKSLPKSGVIKIN